MMKSLLAQFSAFVVAAMWAGMACASPLPETPVNSWGFIRNFNGAALFAGDTNTPILGPADNLSPDTLEAAAIAGTWGGAIALQIGEVARVTGSVVWADTGDGSPGLRFGLFNSDGDLLNGSPGYMAFLGNQTDDTFDRTTTTNTLVTSSARWPRRTSTQPSSMSRAPGRIRSSVNSRSKWSARLGQHGDPVPHVQPVGRPGEYHGRGDAQRRQRRGRSAHVQLQHLRNAVQRGVQWARLRLVLRREHRGLFARRLQRERHGRRGRLHGVGAIRSANRAVAWRPMATATASSMLPTMCSGKRTSAKPPAAVRLQFFWLPNQAPCCYGPLWVCRRDWCAAAEPTSQDAS